MAAAIFTYVEAPPASCPGLVARAIGWTYAATLAFIEHPLRLSLGPAPDNRKKIAAELLKRLVNPAA